MFEKHSMYFTKFCSPLVACAAFMLLHPSSASASTGEGTSMMLGLTTDQGIWVLGVAVVVFFLFDQVLSLVLKASAGRKTRRPRMVSLQAKTENSIKTAKGD